MQRPGDQTSQWYHRRMSSTSTLVSITSDQVSAFRLVRHHLFRRAPRKALVSVLRDMAGAQAQLLSAAQLSLWTRVRDLRMTDIDNALQDRTIVKAACMRRTLFLVPASDLAVFVRGSAGRAEKESRWARGKGVPDRVIDAAIDAALGALDEPLTRSEIAERVGRKLGVQTQAIRGGGWGTRRKVAAVPVGHLTYPVVDLLHLAGARGVVCYGPSRGSEPTFVRADAWIPGWRDVPRQEAESRLLRIYLRAFGPATPADFAMWTGINLREAREIWRREQAGLAAVDVQGWESTVLREDLDKLVTADFEYPIIRLLPHFDSFILGHKDRDHLVDLKHRPQVYRPQGWIVPVVLVNGRIRGVWERVREGERLHLKVTKFGPLSRQVIAAIRAEAEDLGRFLGNSSVEPRIEFS